MKKALEKVRGKGLRNFADDQKTAFKGNTGRTAGGKRSVRKTGNSVLESLIFRLRLPQR